MVLPSLQEMQVMQEQGWCNIGPTCKTCAFYPEKEDNRGRKAQKDIFCQKGNFPTTVNAWCPAHVPR